MKEFNNSAKVNNVDIFGDNDYKQYSVGIGIIDMSTELTDYRIDSTGIEGNNLPKFMFIIPETSGIIKVELIGQDEGVVFTISVAQVTAFLGKPMPYKVRKIVKTATTSTFSVIW